MEERCRPCTRSAKRTKIDRLPHMHEDIEIEKFFPLIKAAPLLINDEDWQPEAEEPEDKVKRVDSLPSRARSWRAPNDRLVALCVCML